MITLARPQPQFIATPDHTVELGRSARTVVGLQRGTNRFDSPILHVSNKQITSLLCTLLDKAPVHKLPSPPNYINTRVYFDMYQSDGSGAALAKTFSTVMTVDINTTLSDEHIAIIDAVLFSLGEPVGYPGSVNENLAKNACQRIEDMADADPAILGPRFSDITYLIYRD